MAKQKICGGQAIVCSRCGKAIPPDENGVVTNCVWKQDRYLCWDCVRAVNRSRGAAAK